MSGDFHQISTLVLEADGSRGAADSVRGALTPLDATWKECRRETAGLFGAWLASAGGNHQPVWRLLRRAEDGLLGMSFWATARIRGFGEDAGIGGCSEVVATALAGAARLVSPFARHAGMPVAARLPLRWARHVEFLFGGAAAMSTVLDPESSPYFAAVLADLQDDKSRALACDLESRVFTMNSASMRRLSQWSELGSKRWSALVEDGFAPLAAAEAAGHISPHPWMPGFATH